LMFHQLWLCVAHHLLKCRWLSFGKFLQLKQKQQAALRLETDGLVSKYESVALSSPLQCISNICCHRANIFDSSIQLEPHSHRLKDTKPVSTSRRKKRERGGGLPIKPGEHLENSLVLMRCKSEQRLERGTRVEWGTVEITSSGTPNFTSLQSKPCVTAAACCMMATCQSHTHTATPLESSCKTLKRIIRLRDWFMCASTAQVSSIWKLEEEKATTPTDRECLCTILKKKTSKK
jgi:hypothetical protein